MLCVLLVCISGVKCPSPGNVAKGRVTPFLAQYLYRDYIFVRCDTGYKLMKVGQHKPLCSVSTILGWNFFFRNPVFTVRMGKSWRVSPPCAKAMESGTSLCQNATVRSQKCLIQPRELLIISCFIVVFPCFFFLSRAVIDCGEPKPLLNGGVIFLSGFDNQYQSVIKYYCDEPFYTLFGGPNGETSAHSDKQHSLMTKSQIQLNIISMLTGTNYFPQSCPLISIIL